MARKKQEPEAQTVLETDPQEEIRLLDLKIQNFRGLRFAHIKVDDEGRIIYVTGKNKAGKSSVLQAIQSLVFGGRETPEEPMNDAAEDGEKSFVRGKFNNNFTVEERFTERGRYLTVTSSDGGEYKQSKLNEWIDGVSGDPIHLWNLPPARLQAVLLGLTSEPDALEKLNGFDELIAAKKDERKPHNSTIMAFQNTEGPDGERPELIDTMALYAQAKDLRAKGDELSEVLRERARTLEAVNEADRQIAALEEKLAEWRGARHHNERALSAIDDRLDTLPDPAEELAAIDAEILKADEQDEALTAWRQWDQTVERVSSARAEAEKLTADIDKLVAMKGKFAASVKSKIPGITFESDLTPMLHGRGLHAASGAEKARMQVDVMFALNPSLKIVLIDEGATLDAEYIQQLDADSQEKGFQVWLCTVQEGIEGEIKIVEGRTVEDGGRKPHE